MGKNAKEHSVFHFDSELVLSKITRSKIILQAILVGLLAGLLVVLFRISIEFFEEHLRTFMQHQTVLQKVFLLPLIGALGGLIAGLLIFKIAPSATGSGIPFVKLTLARIGKGMKIRSLATKFFAGIIGIGTGLSLGREGPSVHLGAGAGTVIAKMFKITGTDKDKLIAAGAGSAIGATFNAPIAGAIFVLEELIHVFSSALLFPVLIATVVAAAVGRHFFGNSPAFIIPFSDHSFGANAIPALLILGLLAGVLGVLFAKNILFNIKLFEKYKNIKPWYKTAFVGFIAGLCAIVLPEITGSGNIFVEHLLSAKYTLAIIVLIFVGKFFLTSFCFGSGAAGGIFMPIMMLGSFTGYATGLFMNTYFNAGIDPPLMALVGMGAFLSSVLRTPITAVIIVFEMTGNYQNILPIMFCAAIADLVAERLDSHPIYSTLIFRQGLDSKKAALLASLSVKDHMVKRVTKVESNLTLSECLQLIKTTLHCGFPVISRKNEVLGIITKSDVEDAVVQGLPASTKITEIMNPNPHVIHEHENMYSALLELHINNTGWLIVVDEKHRIKGIITRFDIKNATTGFMTAQEKVCLT